MSPAPMPLPLYYEGKSLADMEQALRNGFLKDSGWLDSADRKLSVRDGVPLPWFTYGAIEFLERELPTDLSMFEYGGGQSSVYWAGRLRRLVSIDHDPAFGALIQPQLPPQAEFRIVEEATPLPRLLEERAQGQPVLVDPERSVRTYRSGQLNNAFRTYALQILDNPPDSFDVVVIDGMARVLSTWAAIQHFRRGGFIVFDNSDRDIYQPAFDLLADSGYRRIDFGGLGPINPYAWCTSVFYAYRNFTSVRWFEDSRQGEVEARRKTELGILVLGYSRPHHLQSVLESLRQQDKLGSAHVWIDGTNGRAELAGVNEESIALAKRYDLAELRVHHSHLGIEKLMLDGLECMAAKYDRVLVLEDDCFPKQGAVDDFESELARIEKDPRYFSVYGHHFGCEDPDNGDFPRFQGWGWAAHSEHLLALLPELKRLFLLDEDTYCAEIASRMTDDIWARLDVTPGRDVLKVLGRGYSWDSAVSFLSAERGLKHRRTREASIANTGIVPEVGHFNRDIPFFRRPPFNMITLNEAWAQYDRRSIPCDFSRESYGLEGLDLRLVEALGDEPPGFLVEIGANDGLQQSNSVLLEKLGWSGLLIEANPASYARCVRTRPNMMTAHAACVASDFAGSHVTLTDVGLKGMTDRSILDSEKREIWISRGERSARKPRQDIEVPAIPMSRLLDAREIERLDLLLLDVEGAEIDVLRGLDFSRHAPRHILAEDDYPDDVGTFLIQHGYERIAKLSERKYTRDCLYRRKDPGDPFPGFSSQST